MAEYFKIVNLDKSEYLDPFDFPYGGAKLGEFGHDLNLGFCFLLAKSDDGHHAGDVDLYDDPVPWEEVPQQQQEGSEPIEGGTEEVVLGRWAGDRIVLIGDYDSSGLYQQLQEAQQYRNISSLVLSYLNRGTESAVHEEMIPPMPDPYSDPFEA